MNEELFNFVTKLSLNDKKTLSQKCGKVTEENGELAGAILTYENASGFQDKVVKKKQLLEESVDVILSAISIPLSEGYTIEDISKMMYEKTLHWENKQAKEEKVSFPIWYETHITIERPDDVEKYILDCKEIGVKPIILDLQNDQKSIMKDVMTSSKHLGDNSTSMIETSRISGALKNMGYNVVREKIESVPYHPSAPRRFEKKPIMPKDCYFESHIGISITEDRRSELFAISTGLGSHLSQNYFKKNPNGTFVIMLTYRRYDGTLEDFQESVDNIKRVLDYNQFKYEKVITEFALYDTKISHDSKWLEK